MMKLNKEVTVAIAAFNKMATLDGEVIKVNKLATEIGTTEFFLCQVMRKLKAASHIISCKSLIKS